MAKKAKITVNVDVDTPRREENKSNTVQQINLPILFTKKNYQMMLVGLALIFLGFLLMMGKNNNIEGLDAVFPANDIYSVRRIIIAPIVIIIGFLVELYSILLVKKSTN